MNEGMRPLEEIDVEIAELSARIQAATYRLLVCIREFDERGGWADQGARSCAHWLNWRVGLDLGAAREKVRVAHALAGLPLVAEAFRKGEVSYSKVRAVTRIATPETERYLHDIALIGTASHMEKLVRGFRRMTRAEANRQHERRYLSVRWDSDGMLVIEGRLPPEQGALVLKALDAAGDALREQESRAAEPQATEMPSAEMRAGELPLAQASQLAPIPSVPRVGYGERRADALALIAEASLAHGCEVSSNGERYEVVVHVDAEALSDTDAPGRSAVEDGPAFSAETCRRISCDSSLVRILDGPKGEALDIGRKTRAIPPSIRRALHARDGGCRWPGCGCRRYVDGHHVKHWADGGETRLGNLLELCRVHHRLVHEGGFGVDVLADGQVVFRDRFGRHITEAGILPAVAGDPLAGLAACQPGIEITPQTGLPTWLGEKMDYGEAVGWLLDRTEA